jgi:CRISPR-associated protein Cmr3
MTGVFIEAFDVLVLRGNKLFGDPGSYGESLVPPWPSVAAGAVRSAILVRDGEPYAFARGEWRHPALGTPDEPGPFTLTAFQPARRRDGLIEPLFAPAADLFIEGDGDAVVVRTLQPTRIPLASSNPLPLLPVLAQKERTKPAGGWWLTAAGWHAYLAGAPVTGDHLVPVESLWRYDLRVGVGLSADTRSVAEGKLFSVNAVAFEPGVGFLAAIDGADPPADGLLRFGGDGRAARILVVEIDWPQPDLARICRERRARLVLTAPGLFEGGWLPTGIAERDGSYRFDLHGVRARLVAAAVPRAETVSGFDVARSRPKPAVRAAPAGSVYWLDDLEATPEALAKLAQIGLWPSERENDPRRAEGFNRFTFAHFSMEGHNRV